MTGDEVLSLLPARGLDQSILLAVLVGMAVLALLVETYGWVFAGLIVPGYLASVFIVNPAAGATIVFEAVLTYAIVRTLSDLLSRTGAWSPFFGRERFFAIVLVSVAVRQVSEVWLIGAALAPFEELAGTNLVATRELASIGLVLVPLVANMFWKVGAVRGLVQVAIPTGITYAALALVLLPYTNLSFSALELTYENVALDFLGSAKAYVILIVGAFLAARANIRYGWDYNGILVPSLLALTWLTPWSVVVTLVEALVLYGGTLAVLKLPWFRTANLEGPRKLLLVFTLGFALKYAGGWALGDRLPLLKITDLFGFGYALTALLAVKMLQKKTVGRVLLPTLQVSLIAFVVGNVVGYGLEQVSPRRSTLAVPVGAPTSVAPLVERSALGVAIGAVARARPALPASLPDGRDSAELRRYATLWQQLDRWAADDEPDLQRLDELAEQAAELGLSLRQLETKVAGRVGFALVETEQRLRFQTGWDSAVIVPSAPGPFLLVPRPLGEPFTAEAAAVVCESIQCRGLLVSGLDRRDRGRSAADAVDSSRATLRVAAREIRLATTIELRASFQREPNLAQLHLHHSIPTDVDIRSLAPTGDIELSWKAPPDAAADWDDSAALALSAHPASLQQLVASRTRVAVRDVSARSLEQWTQSPLPKLDSAGATRQPTPTELRVLETRLAPVLFAGDRADLAAIGGLAATIDYELVNLVDCAGTKQPCRLLTPIRGGRSRHWATLAVRTGADAPIVIEVPRPASEPGTAAIGTAMWRSLGARAILIDHDAPGTSERPNPVAVGTLATPLQALHQASHHALSGQPQALLLQVRGLASGHSLGADVLVDLGIPVLQPRQQSPDITYLLGADGALAWLGETVRWADGARDLIFLGSLSHPQLSYSRATGGATAAALWVPADRRAGYGDGPTEIHARAFKSTGLSPLVGEPREWLRDSGPIAKPRTAWLRAATAGAERYRRTHSVQELKRLASLPQGDGRAVYAGIDAESRRAYLAFESVAEREVERSVVFVSGTGIECARPATLEIALAQRCAVVHVVGEPKR